MYYLLLILPLSECYRIRTSILDMSDPSLSKMASNPMHSPILPDKHWYALFLPSERTSTHYYNRTFTQALVSFFALLYLYVSLNAQIRNITLLHSSSTSNNNYPQYKAPPYTSKPCLRRISARIRLSFNNPTHVAIPIFFALIFFAKSMISSTRVCLQ